jgi:hypothetical protein
VQSFAVQSFGVQQQLQSSRLQTSVSSVRSAWVLKFTRFTRFTNCPIAIHSIHQIDGAEQQVPGLWYYFKTGCF